MKFTAFLISLLGLLTVSCAALHTQTPPPPTTYVFNQTTTTQIPNKRTPAKNNVTPILRAHHPIRITVTGEGVAPLDTTSPAQAYAMAKRAAVIDAYRQIAARVEGIKVRGHDYVKNMMLKNSSVRTSVYAMIRNAHIQKTTFKDGLCEVQMNILIAYSQFAR